MRADVHFDILCGTSVGAITSCFLAASADVPEDQGRDLSSFWTHLELEKVYRVDGEDLWTITRKLWNLARAGTRAQRRLSAHRPSWRAAFQARHSSSWRCLRRSAARLRAARPVALDDARPHLSGRT